MHWTTWADLCWSFLRRRPAFRFRVVRGTGRSMVPLMLAAVSCDGVAVLSAPRTGGHPLPPPPVGSFPTGGPMRMGNPAGID
jgi:hypothetical protein